MVLKTAYQHVQLRLEEGLVLVLMLKMSTLFVVSTRVPSHIIEHTLNVLDTGNENNFDIRLVNGDVASEGRVEVFYGGQWGTICDDLFDANDASVICRQLGYSMGGVPASFRTFGEGSTSQPIWLDNLACSGMESNITLCPNIMASLGDHNCVHFEDVGVHCFGKLNMYTTTKLLYHCCLIIF